LLKRRVACVKAVTKDRPTDEAAWRPVGRSKGNLDGTRKRQYNEGSVKRQGITERKRSSG